MTKIINVILTNQKGQTMTRDEAIERIRQVVSKENQAILKSDPVTCKFDTSYAEMIGGVRGILQMLSESEEAKKRYRDKINKR